MLHSVSSSAPSHIFIVRHGARLDMADPQWHLTSPTPYDPPLTYGGWTQSRLVGFRIASLLASSGQATAPKNMRIVIHSSPFLRCIQTSVSIAAGIAQQQSENFVKPLMRLDSWLGEWLSEDYYLDICPPPAPSIMISNAKADYIRPSSASSIPSQSPSPPPSPYNNKQIPTGHVSHGKTFVEFDIGWSASNLPAAEMEHEYPEEWPSMHKRFKNGWKHLSAYYSSGNPAVTNFPITWKRPTQQLPPPANGEREESSGDELSTVVILVTHGAGCNALIGAITHKPVLMDIPISSTTMAVRRPDGSYDVKFTEPISVPQEMVRRGNLWGGGLEQEDDAVDTLDTSRHRGLWSTAVGWERKRRWT